MELATFYLARHGETPWSVAGKHTGRTDVPLTEAGESAARKLGERLKGMTFAKVWTSPLQRARRTCELAGLGERAEVDPDLVEWDYGQYEGLTGAEIRAKRPGWVLFRDGCPGGETFSQLAERADRVVKRVRETRGDVIVFSSGHISRVIGARWLGLEPQAARFFMLGTASLSALSYEHDLSDPAVKFWNDRTHVK